MSDIPTASRNQTVNPLDTKDMSKDQERTDLLKSVVKMIRAMVVRHASDIHIHAAAPPYMRVNGELRQLENVRPFTAEQTIHIAKSMMPPKSYDVFEKQHELDFAFMIPNLARFRCNVFYQRGSVSIVMRVVEEHVPDFDTLGLPSAIVTQFSSQTRGFVLITGPTGSGKSTTLASMIDYINENYKRNIITVEDPIEILHRNKRSLVVQRELGSDTFSFSGALKYAMRQDPDVIMIGEMRDRATVEAAITAAQTGHLVFSTLHTLDSIRTVNRIIDFFPPHERDQIRIMLAESLLGIMSQRLLLHANGEERILASEVLVNTPLIRDYIKDETKTSDIKQAIMEGREAGMRTFDQHLIDLWIAGDVTEEEAVAYATSPHEILVWMSQNRQLKQDQQEQPRF
jgi:twitching motility protein PilT